MCIYILFKMRNHNVTSLITLRNVVSYFCLPPSVIPYRDTKGGIRILLSRVSLEQTKRHEDSK